MNFSVTLLRITLTNLSYIKVEVSIKLLWAVRTRISLNSFMYLNVLYKVTSLSKWERARWIVALKRALISMYSDMIIEIVQFSKLFATVCFITFEHSKFSICLRILSRKNSILNGIVLFKVNMLLIFKFYFHCEIRVNIL